MMPTTTRKMILRTGHTERRRFSRQTSAAGYRTHSAQDHRGVEHGVDEVHLFKEMVTQHADSQRDGQHADCKQGVPQQA